MQALLQKKCIIFLRSRLPSSFISQQLENGRTKAKIWTGQSRKKRHKLASSLFSVFLPVFRRQMTRANGTKIIRPEKKNIKKRENRSLSSCMTQKEVREPWPGNSFLSFVSVTQIREVGVLLLHSKHTHTSSPNLSSLINQFILKFNAL